jgi:hypothetical protein
MTMETKLEWVEVSSDRMPQHSRKGRFLWLSNGARSHATVLPSSVSILAALAHYADGHVIAGKKQEVTYQMWQDSQILVSGKHSFKAKQ